MTGTPFAPPTGLVSDDTVFSAPGRWKDASGARFYDGNWQATAGFESLTTDLLNGVCRAVFAWTDISNFLDVAFGHHLGLQVWQGGALYDITPASGFTPGSIDGTGGAGYGTGDFGVGTYGSPSTADYFPLTWSLASYETGDLYANPRNQGIFRWQQDPATPAALLDNAPAACTYILSTDSRQIMALGCSPEDDNTGPADPLTIRFSDIEDTTDWTTTTSNNAGEVVLNGGGRIVTGRVIGPYVFVWTTVSLFLGTYVGDPTQTWRFDKVGDHCGAIGPGAPVITGQSAAWISPDAQFWNCTLGGAPQPVACSIRKEFADNISPGQFDKIVGATISTYQEVKWFYPDARDGLENSRDITVSPQGWCHGQLARTAYVDSGPADAPVGCTVAGNAYWHEKGNTADGGVLSGFIESTDFYIDEDQKALKIEGIWPNFKDQIGPLTMTVFVRENPQSVERVKGPFTLTPGMSKKSLNFSCAIARVRFDWSSAPAYVRGGKQEFDAQPIGKR